MKSPSKNLCSDTWKHETCPRGHTRNDTHIVLFGRARIVTWSSGMRRKSRKPLPLVSERQWLLSGIMGSRIEIRRRSGHSEP